MRKGSPFSTSDLRDLQRCQQTLALPARKPFSGSPVLQERAQFLPGPWSAFPPHATPRALPTVTELGPRSSRNHPLPSHLLPSLSSAPPQRDLSTLRLGRFSVMDPQSSQTPHQARYLVVEPGSPQPWKKCWRKASSPSWVTLWSFWKEVWVTLPWVQRARGEGSGPGLQMARARHCLCQRQSSWAPPTLTTPGGGAGEPPGGPAHAHGPAGADFQSAATSSQSCGLRAASRGRDWAWHVGALSHGPAHLLPQPPCGSSDFLRAN